MVPGTSTHPLDTGKQEKLKPHSKAGRLLPIILVGCFLAASCSFSANSSTFLSEKTQTPTPTIKPSSTLTSTNIPPTATLTETPTATPKPTLTPIPLSVEPREIEFKTSDGITLHGTYYPAAQNPAPLIVLMHWTRGDERDWKEIAFWLQNRRQGRITKLANTPAWLDPAWFPAIPDDRSYGVFTFTYRDCVDGCGKFLQMSMYLDSRAAMLQAEQLAGVAPGKLIAAGASVGADGSVAGCYFLNSIKPNTCQGAFALSPGNYLPLPFLNSVSYLQQQTPPKPVWCLYSEGDEEAEKACLSARGKTYRKIMYKGGKHGFDLIKPGLTPDVLQSLLDFLDLTLGKP